MVRGDFDVLLFAWNVGSLTQGPADIFGCQQPRNYTGYCDRLVTRDLVNATQTLDDARRVGLLNRVDVRLARAVPNVRQPRLSEWNVTLPFDALVVIGEAAIG